MKNRSVLDSPRLKEMKRKKFLVLRNKILLSLFTFLLIFVSLGLFSRWHQINIQSIEVLGNKVVETEDIKKVVEENINGKYLWLFSKKNSLIYPKDKIQANLYDSFKRLKDISFEVKNMKVLEINLKERLGAYTWCGENLPGEEFKLEDTECYFMDDMGYIFDKAPYFSGDVYFRFFGKVEKDKENPAGAIYLKGKFKELTSFVENISKMGLEPSLLLAKEDGDMEIYLALNTNLTSTLKIIFKSESDLNKIAENLQAAINTEPLKSDLIKKNPPLSYIDLRFGNKVYFK
jgi:hypothetical protein